MAYLQLNGLLGGSSERPTDATSRRGYWQEQISTAKQRWDRFIRDGERTVCKYRMEQAQSEKDLFEDRYNILYSSTETTRPSLYAQTPKVQATKRQRDRQNDTATLATLAIEAVAQYGMEEIDFDYVMENVVGDYLLPGLGQAWVRYDPTIKGVKSDNDNGDESYDGAYVESERVQVDYVHYKDFLTGVGRTWDELPWIARRVYFNQKKAKKRFGATKAARLKYTYGPTEDSSKNDPQGRQAIIYEIWDKDNRQVVWFSEDYADDVLDQKDDPLKLKDFWPCPRPLRAVSDTSTFVPKSFYSMYRAQASHLDTLTEKIRYLTEALRVIGVYDGSQEGLQELLNGRGNKLVAINNWAAFAQQNGINGSLQFVPIKDVATVLAELIKQRDVCKAEIYEITGFSDIVRGVSKASETLGAQEIKQNWAQGRLRSLQKEVQRFCRDLIRIISEIQCEHFSDETLALYAGFEPPPVTDEEQQAAAAYATSLLQPGAPAPKPGPTMRQQAIQMFLDVVKLLRSEKQRCALIGIETDSTIQPDEAAERQDRMEFLGQIGAFLQQAGPMALQYPDMRGLMGAIMMFVVRTFRASRPIEKEFEDFQERFANAPAQDPNGKSGEGDNGEAAAQGAVQQEQIKAQVQTASDQMNDATERYKVDQQELTKRQKQQQDHEFRMSQLALEQAKLELERAKLGIEQQKVDTQTSLDAEDQAHRHSLEDDQQAHQQSMDAEGLARQDEQFEAGQANEARRMDIDEAAAQNRQNGS